MSDNSSYYFSLVYRYTGIAMWTINYVFWLMQYFQSTSKTCLERGAFAPIVIQHFTRMIASHFASLAISVLGDGITHTLRCFTPNLRSSFFSYTNTSTVLRKRLLVVSNTIL